MTGLCGKIINLFSFENDAFCSRFAPWTLYARVGRRFRILGRWSAHAKTLRRLEPAGRVVSRAAGSIEVCVDKRFGYETVYFVAYFTEQPYGRAVCTSTSSPFIA